MFPYQKQLLKEEVETREKIVAEAKTWLKTPWHHEARVKGAGVDCGMILLEIFEKVNLIPHISPAHYSIDFMMNREEEWYEKLILDYAFEIFRNPLPGDIILYRHGRSFSHGAIVIEWPKIIHAFFPERCVCWGDVEQPFLRKKIKKMFRYDKFERSGDDIE
jgi:cell wall-associated NlpC family hydrolase